MNTIIAEHMRAALAVVEGDEELGKVVIADELDRLTAESLGHWQSTGAPWSSIPFALHRDIALSLRRIRRARGVDEWPDGPSI